MNLRQPEPKAQISKHARGHHVKILSIRPLRERPRGTQYHRVKVAIGGDVLNVLASPHDVKMPLWLDRMAAGFKAELVERTLTAIRSREQGLGRAAT